MKQLTIFNYKPRYNCGLEYCFICIEKYFTEPLDSSLALAHAIDNELLRECQEYIDSHPEEYIQLTV